MNGLPRLTDEELWMKYVVEAMAMRFEKSNVNSTDPAFAVMRAGCAERVADYLLRQHRERFPKSGAGK